VKGSLNVYVIELADHPLDRLSAANDKVRQTLHHSRNNVLALQFNKRVRYDAKALLNVKGIEAGPEFDMIKHTSFRIADFGADAVDLLKLSVWLTDRCRQDSQALSRLACGGTYLPSK
jgi:hypothetical protein